jgi:hypothetical protein
MGQMAPIILCVPFSLAPIEQTTTPAFFKKNSIASTSSRSHSTNTIGSFFEELVLQSLVAYTKAHAILASHVSLREISPTSGLPKSCWQTLL